MKTYQEFSTPDSIVNIEKRVRLSKWIKKFYKTNGFYPTQEEINYAPIWDSQIEESLKRRIFATYIAKGSDLITTPVVFPTTGDTTGSTTEDDGWIHATYNVTSITQPTRLIFSGANTLREVKIDGVSINIEENTNIDNRFVDPYQYITYSFSTIGEHIVDFLMIDEEECKAIVDEEPSPEYLSFYTISNLIEIEFPSNIVLNEGEFCYCSSLMKITCNSKTAPWINLVSRQYNPTPTFVGVGSNGILRIPKGSDYTTWLDSNLGTNLGTYRWSVEYM